MWNLLIVIETAAGLAVFTPPAASTYKYRTIEECRLAGSIAEAQIKHQRWNAGLIIACVPDADQLYRERRNSK